MIILTFDEKFKTNDNLFDNWIFMNTSLKIMWKPKKSRGESALKPYSSQCMEGSYCIFGLLFLSWLGKQFLSACNAFFVFVFSNTQQQETAVFVQKQFGGLTIRCATHYEAKTHTANHGKKSTSKAHKIQMLHRNKCQCLFSLSR